MGVGTHSGAQEVSRPYHAGSVSGILDVILGLGCHQGVQVEGSQKRRGFCLLVF